MPSKKSFSSLLNAAKEGVGSLVTDVQKGISEGERKLAGRVGPVKDRAETLQTEATAQETASKGYEPHPLDKSPLVSATPSTVNPAPSLNADAKSAPEAQAQPTLTPRPGGGERKEEAEKPTPTLPTLKPG